MHETRRRPAVDAGFTVVEVVVAVAVLSIVTSMALLIVTPATRAVRDAPVLAAAAGVAEQALELARATPCSQLPWKTPSPLQVLGTDAALWSVTGTAMPVQGGGTSARNAVATQDQACAGAVPYQYTATVASVARPSLSVTLTTSVYRGSTQP